MPNSILIPTAQNLPDGFCPTNWQATVNAFAAAMRVTLPTSASQIIVQATTPVPADNDKIWFQVDVNNHVLAIRSYDSATGSWERVDEEQYYFNDIGTTNAIEINSSIAGDNVTALSDIVGRLLIIKVANTNSATTVTIELDGLAATPVKVYGSQSLAVGNIQAGMICAFIYDGTNFQLLNPKYLVPANTYYVYSNKSDLFALPLNNQSQEWLHGLNEVPTYFECYLVCQQADLDYSPGDAVPYHLPDSFFGTMYFKNFNLSASTSALKLNSGGPTLSIFLDHFPKKNGGFGTVTDTLKWKIQFVASKLVAV